jgi:hypothetical protein
MPAAVRLGFVEGRSDEPLSRGKISLADGIHCCPKFFIYFARPASLYCEEYVCIYTYPIWLRRNCIWNTVATNNTASEAVLHKPGELRSVDRICIIKGPVWRWLGEYVTLDSTFYSLLFKQEVSRVPSYFHIFFLIAFLEEALIGNIIIILCINYIIIMYINNAVINNFFKTPKPLFCSSEFPRARARISSKFIDSWATVPEKGYTPERLVMRVSFKCRWRHVESYCKSITWPTKLLILHFTWLRIR